MKTLFAFLIFTSALVLNGAKVSLDAPKEALSAGEVFEVSANFKIPPDSYLYYKNPGESGLPTKIEWIAPKGFELVSEIWPTPQTSEEFGLKTNVYKHDFSVRAKFKAAKELQESDDTFKIRATWLKCTGKMCVPQNGEAQTQIHTLKSESNGSHKSMGVFAAIFGAFMGGLILNLMPCVFPVIGLKILSFAKDAAGSRAVALKNAGLYSAGIVLSFVALAAILLLLKSMGAGLGWGFQLQHPVFVALLMVLFFVMALAFAGFIEIGASLTRFGGASNSAFFSGVLAVLVASPCTAPFMGASLGAALISDTSPVFMFSVFVMLGVGMAFPYVLLSAIPPLARLMPKPGAWMEVLKKLLSIPLFITAFWLAWILFQQSGGAKSDDARQDAWSEEKVSALRNEGKMVYVDFTANWCITCLANKAAVLNTEKIEKLFKEKNVARLTADWTNRDSKIREKLAEFGRSGVPLNVLYPADASKGPIILPEILTNAAVIEAIDKASK